MKKRKTIAFSMPFRYEKSFWPCLVACALIISGGCAPRQLIPPQSQIDGFERIPEIPYSEIPELYDVSKLRIGSMVKFKRTQSQKYTVTLGYVVYKLRSIAPDNIGAKYTFDSEIYSPHKGLVVTSTSRFDKTFTFTFEADTYSLKRLLFSDRVKQVDITYSPSPKDAEDSAVLAGGTLAAGVSGGLAGGIAGVGMWALLLANRSAQEKAAQELAQDLKAKNPHAETRMKIVGFKFVCDEEVNVGNRIIPCKLYQIQTTVRKVLLYFKQDISSTPYIEENFVKMWVSDDVPFGVAKQEIKRVIHLEADKKPIELTDIFEAVEFEP
jgi:hypothetical protein